MVTKSPTVYDVALSAGVSTATVSRYFRQPEKVAERTRQAIGSAVARLGYLPSGIARGLAERRTGVFGLVSFASDEPEESIASSVPEESTVRIVRDSPRNARMYPLFADEVMRGVAVECSRHGLALTVGWGGVKTDHEMLHEVAGRVDGLIVLANIVPKDVLEHVSRRIPVVVIASPPEADWPISHVTVDNTGGMRALTRHLIEDHDVRDLWFLGAEQESSDGWARFDGFCSALRAAGMPVPGKPRFHAPGTRVGARLVAEESLPGVEQLPEAILCANDQAALAVIDVLAERGVDVPQRVAVTGFDGIDAGRSVRPRLTTVEQPMGALGRLAVDILTAQAEADRREAVHRQLPVHVVLRESCGCPSSVE